MERKDVQVLMKRIKNNYNEFIIDDYSISEWYKELKDYSLEDVMKKLEQHFRSEQYGNQPPKVYFLTKFLTKEKDKIKSKTSGIMVRCQICNDIIPYDEYDSHYGRCLSIEYLEKNNMKYFGKWIDKEKYKKMSEQEFQTKYNKFCEFILEKTENEEERENLMKYFLQKD